MAPALTRAEAAAALAARTAEQDRIQANLLELDASFGKRLLAGATLAGLTKLRWDETAADLAWIWEVFAAYSAVVQRAAQILEGTRRSSGPYLTEMSSLLSGPSVLVVGQAVPLSRRQLTASGRPDEHLTLDQAAQRMTATFSGVIEVISAAEGVWSEVSERLDEISSLLGAAKQQAADMADEGLQDQVSTVEAQVRRMRELLNRDPLALWEGQGVASGELDQLLHQARSVATLTAELTRLHEDAARRIDEVGDQVARALACEQDARAAFRDAADKISADQLPPVPATATGLTDRLTGLDQLRTDGRLQRLATELAAIEKDAAAAATLWKETDAAARALLGRRSELRGLLDAYRAKAGRIGAAEDPQLTHRYEVAHDLLWSAPCDLAASVEAVRSYTEAVLAVQRRKA